MNNSGHMNFFRVDFCGLYKVNNPKSHGLELKETLDSINTWVQGRSLSETIPWHPRDARKNKPNAYCKDIYKVPGTGDFVLVLWKQEADNAETLWGAPEDDQTGASEVIKYTDQYKGKPVVWGRPCYYWIPADHDIVVSIKFDNSVTDAQLFSDYITACVTNRVKHPNRVVTYTEKQHAARIAYTSDQSNQFLYRFKMSLLSLDTASAELKNLAAKVTHIIRRETIAVRSKDDRAQWLKLFDNIPFIEGKPKSKTRRIEYEAEAMPTAVEIKSIIEDCSTIDRKPADWDNVGFRTKDKKVTWVDKYRLTDKLQMSNVAYGIYTAKDIYSKININRDEFLEKTSDSSSPKSIVAMSQAV